MKEITLFLREIRIEHTLFALPFAYVGALIGAHGHPTVLQLVWITVAVLGARTAAMAANRLIDRKIDLRNPRTATRGTATGRLSVGTMVAAIVGGLLLTLVAALELNPLCVQLLPIAAFGLLLYPFCKRFTWLTHGVLGAVDGFAPLGAMVAVSGTITPAAWLLFFAVTFWVSGFDIPYAFMDFDIDRAQGIASLPARFGLKTATIVFLSLHWGMFLSLIGVAVVAHVRGLFIFAPLGAAVLIAYEYLLLRNHTNAFTLNGRLFDANMLFSGWVLLATLGEYALPQLAFFKGG